MDHPTLPAPPGRWPLTLLVITLHLLLLGALQWNLGRIPKPPHPEGRRVTVRLFPLPAPLPIFHGPADRPRRPAATGATPARIRLPAPLPPTPPGDPSPSTTAAADVPRSLALPSSPAASAAPRERLIDSAATRASLRQAAREPLNAERHLAAQGQESGVSASEKLGRQMQQAGYGDCGKGQYAGAGMGLLSVPFYLVAEASGKCAKGSPPPAGPPPPEPSGRNGAHASMRER